MKTVYYLLVAIPLTIAICLSGCSYVQKNNDVLFQTSTINALLNGVYDGDISFQELKQYGGFGLGTVNALDGEMIGLEGKFYQIKADGIAYPVDDSMKTPFAVVTFFEPDKSALLGESINNYSS